MAVRINDFFVEKEYRLTTSIRELAGDIVCYTRIGPGYARVFCLNLNFDYIFSMFILIYINFIIYHNHISSY